MKKALGKRERNRLERRGQILETARAVFCEDGYAATTMSGIASKLGGSKATLWSYFSSKEELFEAAVEALINEFQSELWALLPESSRSRNDLKNFCVSFVKALSREDIVALYRLVLGEGGRFPELGRLFYEKGPKRMQSRVAEYLIVDMPDEQAQLLAKIITAALVGYRNEAIFQGRAYRREATVDFVDKLLASLPIDLPD